MKRIICILLMLLLTLPACGEENRAEIGSYVLAVPEDVQTEKTESSVTFVQGNTRVVVILIERVPDADPESAVIRMMAQFDPDAMLEDDLLMAEGYVGLNAVATDKFGEGVDQLTTLVLGSTGELLILSGYDMDGDETKVQALVEQLLAGLTHDGEKLMMTKE